MTKGVSPEEETTGRLTVSYFAYVSVEEEEQIPQAAQALEAPLRKAVEESLPGQAGCVQVAKVTNVTPPKGSGYLGWTVMLTVMIDLTVWRRDLSLVNGRYAATTVRDLLADADLTGTAARLDRVETKLMVHAPA